MNATDITSTTTEDKCFSEETAPEGIQRPPVNWRERVALLPRVMRWVGGSTLCVAAICFLFNGVSEYTDIARFWHFLAFNSLLAAIGMFCALRFNDDKGARTFMALASGMLPVHFAYISGALWTLQVGAMPRNGIAQALNIEALYGLDFLLPLLATLIVTPVIAYLGFCALARPVSGRLTLAYLAMNALLIPTLRDPHIVTLGAMAATGGLIALDRRSLSKPLIMKSWDGVCVRAMLYVPIVIAIVRNIVGHGADQVLYSYLAGTLSTLLLLVAPSIKYRGLQFAARGLAYPLAYVSFLWATDGTALHYLHWSTDTVIPVFLLPCAALTFAMSYFCSVDAQAYRKLATWAGMTLLALQTIVFQDDQIAFLGLLASAAMIGAGFMREHRDIFRAGIVGMVLSSLYLLKFALLLGGLSIWLKLAVAGTLIILGGSYLERYGRQTTAHIQQLHSRVKGWK